MARRPKAGEPNKSQAIREMFIADPDLKVKDVVSKLNEKGISVTANLVYLVKGKLKGEKRHRSKMNKSIAKVASAGNLDAVKTIVKVKNLASELGGLANLRAVVEALNA